MQLKTYKLDVAGEGPAYCSHFFPLCYASVLKIITHNAHTYFTVIVETVLLAFIMEI